MPSPRRPDPALLKLGDEAARLILQEMRASTNVLKSENIVKLARLEIKLPTEKASRPLLEKIGCDAKSVISHAQLIKALFMKPLIDSEAGKTMLTMRKLVMQQYGIDGPTLRDFDAMEDERKDFKTRQMLNMSGEAKACATVLVGIGRPALSSSQLPMELISFWKAIDAELCTWARENPLLKRAEIEAARSNLGFDLLVTRLVMPLLTGPADESHLVVPQLFCTAVKEKIIKKWPDFFESFLIATGYERGFKARAMPQASAAPSITASATASSSTSTSVPLSVGFAPAQNANSSAPTSPAPADTITSGNGEKDSE